MIQQLPEVFGWLADQEACGYYRIKLPFSQLATLGYKISHNRYMPERLWQPSGATLVGQRVCKDGPSMLWQKHATTQGVRPKLVYEVDDDLLDVDPDNEAAYQWFSRPDVRANITRNIEVSDVVIASTPHLGGKLRRLNPNTVVVPNMVDERLLEIDGQPNHQEARREVVVGWQGSATHQADWEQVYPALRQTLRRQPHMWLHTWGTQYMAGDRVRHQPWQPDFWSYYHSLKMDIMLAPLKPSVFNRSKSHIRVLEAAALGIPVIASHFGPYADFVRHGVTGYLVNRDHEWAKYLVELINDPAARTEMGLHAKRQAREHTIQGGVEQWIKALSS